MNWSLSRYGPWWTLSVCYWLVFKTHFIGPYASRRFRVAHARYHLLESVLYICWPIRCRLCHLLLFKCFPAVSRGRVMVKVGQSNCCCLRLLKYSLRLHKKLLGWNLAICGIKWARFRLFSGSPDVNWLGFVKEGSFRSRYVGHGILCTFIVAGRADLNWIVHVLLIAFAVWNW